MTFGFRKLKYVSLTYIMGDITITEKFKILRERKYFCKRAFSSRKISNL